MPVNDLWQSRAEQLLSPTPIPNTPPSKAGVRTHTLLCCLFIPPLGEVLHSRHPNQISTQKGGWKAGTPVHTRADPNKAPRPCPNPLVHQHCAQQCRCGFALEKAAASRLISQPKTSKYMVHLAVSICDAAGKKSTHSTCMERDN